MDLLQDITVNITPEEVKRIVTEAVEKQFATLRVDSVTFDLSSEWQGCRQGEHQVWKLKGVKVKLEPSTKT